ncbi:hypothetical protein AC249_AIPGENE5499 [Exaiptasia diaphana]|nr:hypothetical protein AC249_AIPGENE5499 [Exaiptasia diaphana]
MSSNYSKKETQQTKVNKTQRSSSGNTNVTTTSAHIEQKATASKDEKQKKATSNPHVSSPSESSRTIIAYIPNLSSIKRNRKNTVDYATLSLQPVNKVSEILLLDEQDKIRLEYEDRMAL